MTTILNPVAKINALVAEDLYGKDSNWDIFSDGDCNLIINALDAEEELDPNDYVIIDFTPPFIGMPVPRRKRK